jgi:hypothetical protein
MNAVEYENKRDDLFGRWKQARPEYENEAEGTRFTIDGIVNYDAWKKAKPKILFLLKENHDKTYEPYEGITVDSKPFSLNIARWRQLLIELYKNPANELSFENINLPKGINDIAIVEVKKLNNRKSKSDNNEISKFAERDMEFLKEQIEIINPDIIFCGYTGDAYQNYLYNGNILWERLISDSNCHCFKDDNRLMIDFYHPSTFNATKDEQYFNILYKMIKNGNVFEKFDWGN